jgi:hypothetical protein
VQKGCLRKPQVLIVGCGLHSMHFVFSSFIVAASLKLLENTSTCISRSKFSQMLRD